MTLSPSDFLGKWSLARQIEDALSGAGSTFHGTALISEQDYHWEYFETGELLLAGAQAMKAERRYIWKADQSGVDVHFCDGRFFHRLHCANEAAAQHWCNPDQYDVAYDFSNWPNWQNTWSVRGSKKSYTMTSAYIPIL